MSLELRHALHALKQSQFLLEQLSRQSHTGPATHPHPVSAGDATHGPPNNTNTPPNPPVIVDEVPSSLSQRQVEKSREIPEEIRQESPIQTPPREDKPLVGDTVGSGVHHKKYSRDSEVFRFFVDGEVFTVHGLRFQRESDEARRLLARKSERPDGIIFIDGLRAVDFERFLDVVHCDISEKLPFTSAWKWVSVLKVAHRFNFRSVHALAIKQLSGSTTSVDKIVLAREFGVDEWLPDAYREVCVMPSLPSDEDCNRLGFDTFKKVARARDTLSAFTPTADYEVRRVVQEVFQLQNAPASVELPAPYDGLTPGTTVDGHFSRFVEGEMPSLRAT